MGLDWEMRPGSSAGAKGYRAAAKRLDCVCVRGVGCAGSLLWAWWPFNVWNLSSLTKDQTGVPCMKSGFLTTGSFCMYSTDPDRSGSPRVFWENDLCFKTTINCRLEG